jgi:uncharacterized membrane protein
MSKKKFNRARTAETIAVAEPESEAGYAEAASQVDRHLPVLFLGLGVGIGLLYAFVMPPLQVADEMMHFARLYSVSRGVCVASPDIDIPQSYAQLNDLYPAWLERHRRISIADLRSSLKLPPNESVMAGDARQRSLDGFINQNLYSCLPWIPAAIVLNAGRHLHFSALGLMYLSRVTNLAVYLVLTFFALRLLPDFRWILFCVALMPMAMHQAASASADSTGFALTFLLCAYVFRLAFAKQSEMVGARQYVVIGLLILLVVLCKSLLAVVALPLVIPAASFGSPRNRWLAIITFALLAVACVAFWQHVNQANFQRLVEERTMRPKVGLPPIDVPGNIRFLLEHPADAAAIFVRSATDADYVIASVAQMVGRLGWFSLPLPDWLVLVYFALLVTAATTQTRDTNLTWFARSVLLLFVALGVAITLAAGWVFETPKAVLGLPSSWERFRAYSQGRYWIPLAFPALMVLTNSKTRLNPRVFAVIAVAVILIATAVAMQEIETTYYI